VSSAVNEELKQYFRPEFLNRLDEIIVFQQLTKTDVRKICDIMVAQLCKRVKEQGITLLVSEQMKDKLADDGFNPIYGARPLRRVIMHLLEDNLAGSFLQESFKPGACVKVDLDDNNEVAITVDQDAKSIKSDEAGDDNKRPQRRRFASSTLRKRKTTAQEQEA
jgi:ATP-dependent Clp protease ATP-binding subunit ClpC